jgi:hypothetical protein
MVTKATWGSLRSTVGVGMIWLAIVAGVSATAWFAIDRAGRDLTGGDITSLTSLSPAATSHTTSGSGPPPVVATPRPSASTPGPAGSPTAQPSGSATRPAASSSARPAGSASSPAASTTPQDRNVSVAGGQVSVRCTGATILLRVAQPDNGWRVDVDASGPKEVVLRFESGAEGSERESHLKAVCANDTPAFTFEDKS